MAHFLSASLSDIIYNSLTQQSSLVTAVWLILLFDNKVPMKMHSTEYICVISDNVCVRSWCTIQVRVQDRSMLQNKYKCTEVWIITLTCYLLQFDFLSSGLFTELIYVSLMISSFGGTLLILQNVSSWCLVLTTEINGRWDPLRWPRDTLYPQKLALTSLTSDGRSVGIVRLRTTSHRV
jgi:hypothetical protein